MLRKGNAYAFQVLSDRAFGTSKETHQVDIPPYANLSQEDLVKQIRELEHQLGVPSTEPEILPSADESSDSKPN